VAQQLRQLGEIRRHPPGLVPCEAVHVAAPARLILKIKVAKYLVSWPRQRRCAQLFGRTDR
jgi:hypothetical protein